MDTIVARIGTDPQVSTQGILTRSKAVLFHKVKLKTSASYHCRNYKVKLRSCYYDAKNVTFTGKGLQFQAR
jgi:hypothetical protein